MRKLVAVGVLIGGLLAGAGMAMAQNGGNADRMSLAASGVFIPFQTGGPAGLVATVEVASPVDANKNLHMIFYNATCVLAGSTSLPETTNDIGFVQVATVLAPITNPLNGLVTIASSSDLTNLVPLQSAIHTRVYEFGSVDGRSRIFEPIIIDSFEFLNVHLWSPLRTGGTFFSPLEVPGSVSTVLTLTCPRNTIQHYTTTQLGAFPKDRFPAFEVVGGFTSNGFNPGPTQMRGKVYDTNEVPLRDVFFTCDCLTTTSPTNDWTGGAVYKSTSDPLNTIGASLGTYTEIEVQDPNPDTGKTSGAFTAWREVATVGSSLNIFFGPMSNGSRNALKNLTPFGYR